MILESRRSGRSFGLAFAIVLVSASAAAAQGRPWEDRGFLNVNFAQQTTERKSVTSGGFPLYDEEATFESTVTVGSAAMFDIMGGARVWRNLAVGLAYARYSDPSTAAVTGSVPDPLVTDSPHAFTTAVLDQEHTENAVHVSATWMLPLGNDIDVAVFAGPSFISLSKDLVTGFTVEPEATVPSSITSESVSGTGVGGHIGVDIRYTVLDDLAGIRKLGFGLFIRYSGASVDANVDGGKIDVGGFNYGLGLRIGF